MSRASEVPRALCVAVLTVLVLSAPAAAQPAASPPPAVSTLFETATSDLVLIEFWARDDRGAALSGLTATDIELVVDAHRQPILSLEPALRSARRAEAAAPGAPSDETAAAAGPGRRFLIFFNDALSKPDGMTRARQAAIDFVKSGGAPGDQFAVAAAGEHKRLRVLKDFSADRPEVVAALQRSVADVGRVSSVMLERDRPMLPTGQEPAFIKERENALAALQEQSQLSGRSMMYALQALVETLAAYKGPKALVYFGDGMSGVSVLEIEDLSRTASAGQVTVHGAVTEGLVAGSASAVRAASVRAANLTTVVDQTGGLRTVSNDAAGLFRAMDAADDGAYVLSFAPVGPADGKPHSVQLACTRPGVSLRYRHQFIRETPEQARTRALEAAFIAPEMHRDIGLDAMMPAGEGKRDLLLYIPSDRLLFLPGPEAATAQVEVGVVAQDADGMELARLSRRLQVRRGRDDAGAGNLPINLRLRQAIPPEARSVTAVVSDVQSGALGAARVDPAAESHSATLLGLAIGGADERSLWLELAAGTTKEPAAARPVVKGARRASFLASERPLCELRLTGAPASLERGLRLVLMEENASVLIQPLGSADVVEGSGPGLILRTRLSLKDVVPGSYILKLEESGQNGPRELGRTPLRVAPPRPGGGGRTPDPAPASGTF